MALDGTVLCCTVMCQVRAEEVILAGGAVNSPQLLQLSGVGDTDQLREVGVQPQHHLPGVGANLQDHLELYVAQQCKQDGEWGLRYFNI